MSFLGSIYQRAYDALCGRPPNLMPWHFQWLGGKDLYRDLRRLLGGMRGDVLDVGCGTKPYRLWFGEAGSYVGLDVEAGDGVDIVTSGNEPWPLADSTFDVVLCTQVLEHVSDLELVLGEIRRVLRPGGRVIASFPFIFNEHGAPHDYRRVSIYGARILFERDYEVEELSQQGGAGSSAGQLLLNWIELQTNRTGVTRLLKGILLPLWILSSGVVNLAGWIVDMLDGTGDFYGNVMVVARKK